LQWNQLIDDLGRTVALFLLSDDPVGQLSATRLPLPRASATASPKRAAKTQRA
jgi:hypothetical protein